MPEKIPYYRKRDTRKKIICALLALVLCLSVTACGGASTETTIGRTAFDASKEAYDCVSTAYEITDQFASDVYEAWRLGIYEDDSITSRGASYLAGELNLSEEELIEGIVYTMLGGTDEDYQNATEEEKQEYRDWDVIYFSLNEDSLFSACIWAVTGAYAASGKTKEAQTALDDAKAIMREMSEKYSDYEHYPSLKGYYTTTSSYFNFCSNPDGSFEQVKTTINDYRNEARDYISDLDYIFED